MKLHRSDWAVMTVIAGAGCAAIYAGLRSGLTSAVRRAVEERQGDMERQLNAMATTVKALQARVTELSRLQAVRVQEAEVAVIATPAGTAGHAKQAQTKPEIVAALTAAATAFLGKKARVRSAQLLPNTRQDSAGAWAQQGRMIVQTSHNPRQRG
ncbi:MAG TPA: hypothetical protein VJX73_01655 [Terracidiphilus sp.]|nr:hypothetical protein [Terracidiphilus sp.]